MPFNNHHTRYQICCACLAALVCMTGCDDRRATQYTKKSDKLTPDTQITTPATPTTDSKESLELATVTQFHMGMLVQLTCYAPTESQGQKACANAFKEVRKVNMLMSDYEPRSELSKLCRAAGNGPMKISDELFEVLTVAKKLAQQTEGLYDPTAAPVIRLWRQARRAKKLPDPDQLQAALKLVGYDKLILDPKNKTAELKLTGMKLDLGAIAKGYAGDKAVASLKAQGITRTMFSAGGDMVFGDPPPDEKGWPVQTPHDTIETLETLHLANCAIGISGDTVQYVIIDGKRYSHVVDPRTGQGITTRQMAIVIAPTGFQADPLATIGTLLPAEAYKKFIKTHYPKVQAWSFVTDIKDQTPKLRIPEM